MSDAGGPGSTGQLRIAFGDKPGWLPTIEANIDRARYAPVFGGFADCDPAQFDALVPLALVDYGQLARIDHLRGRKFFRPPDDVVALCNDKRALTLAMTDAGFGASVPALREPGPPYPYVWKGRVGQWGTSCRFIAGPKEEAGIEFGDPGWFAQEAISDTREFATHILRVGGRILYHSTMSYEMATSGLIKGILAKPLRQRRSRDCAYLPLFERILAQVGYEGTACIDYKIVDGAPKILEVNPRVGGTLCGDINAYLDAYVAALDRNAMPAPKHVASA